MNPTPSTPAQSPAPFIDFNTRFLTANIPVRWRAAILVLGTFTLFPIIICVMMFNVVTHDMPGITSVFRRIFRAVGGWFRHSRAKETRGELSYPDFADPTAALRGTV
jgi:hypothetical protein